MSNTKSHLKAGQHVIITGGSSGLGLELAHQLAGCGARLTLLARDQAKLASARDEVIGRCPGAAVDTVAVDVSDRHALDRALTALAKETGRIDVLVNSAGILREGYFEELTDEDFDDVMNTNFFGTVNAIRAALPHLKDSGGAIVNIASIAGLLGVFGYTPYYASKHALVGFTNSLRYELEPQGVSVYLVCPSEFDSPMVDALDVSRTPENHAHVLMVPKLTVDQIARETISGVRNGSPVIVPGQRARLTATANRLFPKVARAVCKKRIATVYRGPSGT